jgi:hypothetical protein
MDGDGWIGGVSRQRLVLILLQHLDVEYLLADLLVLVSEKFIIVETLAVLLVLCDLNWFEELDRRR